MWKLTLLSICVLFATTCKAKIITVDDNGPSDFNTIQAAIDDVNTIDGDEIVVSEGTYYESINPNGKAITIRSTNPLDSNTILNTVIDSSSSSGSGIAVNSGEDANTVITGFLITGGTRGIACISSSPTFTNCSISGNSCEMPSDSGAGMYCLSSNPALTNCTFSGNLSMNNGGGMFCGASSNPTLTNCSFSGNSSSKHDGGGIYCSNSSNPTLTNCTFIGNSASDRGGGIYSDSANPILTDSLICGNFISDTLAPSQINGSFTDNGGNIINDACPPPATKIEGDLDGDGDVDFNDFAIFANNWLAGVE
jgi:predicted outer membrane repeat protein